MKIRQIIKNEPDVPEEWKTLKTKVLALGMSGTGPIAILGKRCSDPGTAILAANGDFIHLQQVSIRQGAYSQMLPILQNHPNENIWQPLLNEEVNQFVARQLHISADVPVTWEGASLVAVYNNEGFGPVVILARPQPVKDKWTYVDFTGKNVQIQTFTVPELVYNRLRTYILNKRRSQRWTLPTREGAEKFVRENCHLPQPIVLQSSCLLRLPHPEETFDTTGRVVLVKSDVTGETKLVYVTADTSVLFVDPRYWQLERAWQEQSLLDLGEEKEVDIDTAPFLIAGLQNEKKIRPRHVTDKGDFRAEMFVHAGQP